MSGGVERLCRLGRPILRSAAAQCPALTGLLTGAVLMLGIQAHAEAPKLDADSLAVLREFVAVWDKIHSSYVRAPDDQTLREGCLSGTLTGLDARSDLLTAEEFSLMQVQQAQPQSRGGLGFDYGRAGNGTVVTAVIDGGPAWRAGVKPGSRILAIDGKDVRDLSTKKVVALSVGAPGSEVRLRLGQPNSSEVVELSLKREAIVSAPASSIELDGGIRYLRVPSFIKGGSAALAAILTQAPRPRGLVLDLRNNPGGILNEGAETASMFLPENAPVVQIVNGREPMSVLYDVKAQRQALRLDDAAAMPMVILIDTYTNSVAEIVAGALRDQGRALLIGERTQGHGEVQTIVPMPDGNALKLTTGWYRLPSGRLIRDRVEPDQVVGSVYPRQISDSASAQRDPAVAAAIGYLATSGTGIEASAPGVMFQNPSAPIGPKRPVAIDRFRVGYELT